MHFLPYPLPNSWNPLLLGNCTMSISFWAEKIINGMHYFCERTSAPRFIWCRCTACYKNTFIHVKCNFLDVLTVQLHHKLPLSAKDVTSASPCVYLCVCPSVCVCWSPRLAYESIIVNNWLGVYVCLFVCHKLQIASFLFLDGIEPFFGCQFSMTPLQNVFFDFWFRPHNTQNLLPKTACDNVIFQRP